MGPYYSRQTEAAEYRKFPASCKVRFILGSPYIQLSDHCIHASCIALSPSHTHVCFQSYSSPSKNTESFRRHSLPLQMARYKPMTSCAYGCLNTPFPIYGLSTKRRCWLVVCLRYRVLDRTFLVTYIYSIPQRYFQSISGRINRPPPRFESHLCRIRRRRGSSGLGKPSSFFWRTSQTIIRRIE